MITPYNLSVLPHIILYLVEMIRVGITGGIGAGKTTVCRLFEKLGVPVYYADQAAKRLMYKDCSLKKAIKELLGPTGYHQNGRPNRAAIAQKVFSDKDLLQALNAVVHPAVEKDAEDWFRTQKGMAPYALYEAALLVENGSYKRYDRLISVSAPEEVRIQRVMRRDGATIEQVKARLSNQLSQAKKDDVADYVIVNTDFESLGAAVTEVDQQLRKLATT